LGLYACGREARGREEEAREIRKEGEISKDGIEARESKMNRKPASRQNSPLKKGVGGPILLLQKARGSRFGGRAISVSSVHILISIFDEKSTIRNILTGLEDKMM